jgi:hypothetical protein
VTDSEIIQRTVFVMVGKLLLLLREGIYISSQTVLHFLSHNLGKHGIEIEPLSNVISTVRCK